MLVTSSSTGAVATRYPGISPWEHQAFILDPTEVLGPPKLLRLVFEARKCRLVFEPQDTREGEVFM